MTWKETAADYDILTGVHQSKSRRPSCVLRVTTSQRPEAQVCCDSPHNAGVIGSENCGFSYPAV